MYLIDIERDNSTVGLLVIFFLPLVIYVVILELEPVSILNLHRCEIYVLQFNLSLLLFPFPFSVVGNETLIRGYYLCSYYSEMTL